MLEASGGYESQLVKMLHDHEIALAVVNPRRVRDFAKGIGMDAKTDPIDARLPTYREELEAAGASNFKELLEHQKRKMHLDDDEQRSPEEEASRLRWMAFGGITVGLISGSASLMLFLVTEQIWVTGVGLGAVMCMMGFGYWLKSFFVSRTA